jgi:hypothetical protein
MTVAELIARLQEFPSELKVFSSDSETGPEPVDYVEVKERGPYDRHLPEMWVQLW